VGAHCSERNLGLLRELRYVASEVGLAEARRMPTEVRKWWMGEMQREGAAREAELERARNGRR